MNKGHGHLSVAKPDLGPLWLVARSKLLLPSLVARLSLSRSC